ncbi:MAG: hypothetical protein AAF797_11390 [Planctomycetota bacterium]
MAARLPVAWAAQAGLEETAAQAEKVVGVVRVGAGAMAEPGAVRLKSLRWDNSRWMVIWRRGGAIRGRGLWVRPVMD